MELNANWITQTIITLGIGTIAYFLKDFKKSVQDSFSKMHKSIEDNEKKIEKSKEYTDAKVGELNKELNDLKADLPFIYVTREDHIRQMNNIDRKLDRIYDALGKKEG